MQKYRAFNDISDIVGRGIQILQVHKERRPFDPRIYPVPGGDVEFRKYSELLFILARDKRPGAWTRRKMGSEKRGAYPKLEDANTKLLLSGTMQATQDGDHAVINT